MHCCILLCHACIHHGHMHGPGQGALETAQHACSSTAQCKGHQSLGSREGQSPLSGQLAVCYEASCRCQHSVQHAASGISGMLSGQSSAVCATSNSIAQLEFFKREAMHHALLRREHAVKRKSTVSAALALGMHACSEGHAAGVLSMVLQMAGRSPA